jgi:hypothetical protein
VHAIVDDLCGAVAAAEVTDGAEATVPPQAEIPASKLAVKADRTTFIIQPCKLASCLMRVVPGVGRKSNLELQNVGAGRLANFEPFGKIIWSVVRCKKFEPNDSKCHQVAWTAAQL